MRALPNPAGPYAREPVSDWPAATPRRKRRERKKGSLRVKLTHYPQYLPRGTAVSTIAVVWEPMPREEARRVADSIAPSGSTDAKGWARMVEVWMVLDGRDPADIRKAVEGILGHKLD